MSAPFVLAVTGVKTNAGRTTVALSLAWALGRRGLRVLLVDANQYPEVLPGRAEGGPELWPGVLLGSRRAGEAQRHGASVVVLDAPALTDPLAERVLRAADSILVCVPPIVQTLRVLPEALGRLEALGRSRVLGWFLAGYDAANQHHRGLEADLAAPLSGWERLPSLPRAAEMAQWRPLAGEEAPEGALREAVLALAERVAAAIDEAAAVKSSSSSPPAALPIERARLRARAAAAEARRRAALSAQGHGVPLDPGPPPGVDPEAAPRPGAAFRLLASPETSAPAAGGALPAQASAAGPTASPRPVGPAALDPLEAPPPVLPRAPRVAPASEAPSDPRPSPPEPAVAPPRPRPGARRARPERDAARLPAGPLPRPWRLLGPGVTARVELIPLEARLEPLEDAVPFPDPEQASSLGALVRAGVVTTLDLGAEAVAGEPCEPGSRLRPDAPAEAPAGKRPRDRTVMVACQALLAGEEEAALVALERGKEADARFLAGVLRLARGEAEAARAHLAVAAADDRQLGRALARLELGVLVALTLGGGVTVHLGPHLRGARLARLAACVRCGDEEGAADEARALAELDPDDPLLLALACEQRVGGGRTSELVEVNRAIPRPGHATIVDVALALAKGQALHRLGMPDAARKVLGESLHAVGERFPALRRALLYERALVFGTLRRAERARRDLEVLYAEAPDWADVAARLGL